MRIFSPVETFPFYVEGNLVILTTDLHLAKFSKCTARNIPQSKQFVNSEIPKLISIITILINVLIGIINASSLWTGLAMQSRYMSNAIYTSGIHGNHIYMCNK